MPIAGLSSERLITNRLGFNKNSLNPACGGRGRSRTRSGIRGIARTVPTIVTTRAYQKGHHRRLTPTAGGKANGERTGRSARDLVSLTYPPRIEGGPGRRVRLNVTTYTLCPMPRRAPVVTPLNPAQGPRSTRFRGDRAEQRRTGRAERASMWTGWSLGTSRTKEPLPCAPMPASGRIRASRTLHRHARLNADDCMG